MSTVNEIVREQTAEYTVNGWTMSRIWQVELDSIAWASIAAVNAVRNDTVNGANIGDRHPVGAYAFLKTLTPSPTENRKVWRVTGQYEQGSVPSWPGNPLEAPSEVAWGSATYTEPAGEDIDGNAIVNSAGQPFDPPLTIERRALVATIVYNDEIFNPAQAYYFQGAVNDNATTIGNLNVQARQAKIIEIAATKQYYEDIEYWQVTVKVEINADTWDRQVLDQGLYEKDPDDATKRVRMTTDDGEGVTEPLKLDGSGNKLDPQSADPVFLTYKTFREMDFGLLNLEVS